MCIQSIEPETQFTLNMLVMRRRYSVDIELLDIDSLPKRHAVDDRNSTNARTAEPKRR
jgi:hypothetical protein